MSAIFISYRKQGVDKASALHLALDMRESLGQNAVFLDQQLGLGKFDDQLLDSVQSCRAMLAVIGPDWHRRITELQNAEDWVRRELEAGLKRRILMVPVLVDDAQLPSVSELPTSLRRLFDYQVVHLYPHHWKDNVSALIDELAEYLNLPKEQPRVAAIPNLAGDWFDTDGVHLRLEHRGENLQIYLLDNRGHAVGGGSGTISGNQIRFSIRRPDYGHGTGTATVSPDGRQISGAVQYSTQRFGFSISRG